MASVAETRHAMRRSPRRVRFADLCKVCGHYFGDARQRSTEGYISRYWRLLPAWSPKMNIVDQYSYRVSWTEEDQEYVATCAEFPSLSWLDGTPESALSGIRQVVAQCVEDMEQAGEPVPQPLSTKSFSGRFMVRVPPQLHRQLATQAAESGVSLNRLVAHKLSQR